MAKILIVDDDPDFLDMLHLVLGQRAGHETILSAEGEDGLAKALADPPDLVILDVMMPGVTGYDICRQLRADPATASVPIIILTARGQPVDRQAALDAGADDYMSKPIVMEELVEHVDALLKRGGQAPAFEGTVAVLSLRGGVGVTTLAVNVAAALAQSEERPVCLADLCPSSGHVALHLGLRPEPNWSVLLQEENPEAVGSHLLQHSSGLRVLASPIFPLVGRAMPRAFAQQVLDTLHSRFAVTVVDTPSTLDPATLAALESATAILLVITPESPSLQTAIGTLRTLKRWASKFHVVLNQPIPGAQPPTAALERALKRPLTTQIPFDPTQAQALGQGKPLVLHQPDAPLAQAVRGLTPMIARPAGG